MDSWLNIPAPAPVKGGSDVGAEMGGRLKVTVAQADVKGNQDGFIKANTKKTSRLFPGSPVP
jgi:hypothetical protein